MHFRYYGSLFPKCHHLPRPSSASNDVDGLYSEQIWANQSVEDLKNEDYDGGDYGYRPNAGGTDSESTSDVSSTSELSDLD